MKVIGMSDGDDKMLLLSTRSENDTEYVKILNLHAKKLSEELPIDQVLRFMPCEEYSMPDEDLQKLLREIK